QNVDLYFISDNTLLILKIIFVDIEAAHTVGLRPKDCLGLMSGHDGEVVCKIEPRRAVEDAAVAFDQFDVFHFAQILGALEHQVLKQMGKTRAVARLYAEAYIVIDSNSYERGRMLRRKHNLQAV